MKQISLRKNLAIVRLCIIATILVIVSLFLLSFKTAEVLTGDLWKQLGITEKQASEKMKSSFLYGYMDYYSFRNARNMAAGDRPAIAKDLVLYSKSYFNSPAFKAAYEKERAAAKPEALKLEPVSKESVRKQRIEEVRKSIKETEELIKKVPSMEKDGRKAIAEYEKSIKDYESPNSKLVDVFYESALNEQKYEQQRYEKRLQEWGTNYPEDPRKKVKKILEKYLALAATVDFDAELTEKYNRKVFVKRDYEVKNNDWKAIFRAGKEVYVAVKPIAEQWVKEIQ